MLLTGRFEAFFWGALWNKYQVSRHSRGRELQNNHRINWVCDLGVWSDFHLGLSSKWSATAHENVAISRPMPTLGNKPSACLLRPTWYFLLIEVHPKYKSHFLHTIEGCTGQSDRLTQAFYARESQYTDKCDDIGQSCSSFLDKMTCENGVKMGCNWVKGARTSSLQNCLTESINITLYFPRTF